MASYNHCSSITLGSSRWRTKGRCACRTSEKYPVAMTLTPLPVVAAWSDRIGQSLLAPAQNPLAGAADQLFAGAAQQPFAGAAIKVLTGAGGHALAGAPESIFTGADELFFAGTQQAQLA